MIFNYLKITFRSLWKSKLFVIINVLGMGVAMACCIVAYLNSDYNFSYDRQHVNASKIYRINFVRDFQGTRVKHGISPIPLKDEISGQMNGVSHVVRQLQYYANFRKGDELFASDLYYVDEDFFDVFTFPLLSGPKSAIRDKSSIFISSELALKHFGEEEALGKNLTHVLNDGSVKDYNVAGVFEKMPLNSSFQFDAIAHFENFYDMDSQGRGNWAYWCNSFLYIENPDDVPVITKELQSYREIQNRAKEDFQVSEFYLDPFEGMAIRAEMQDLDNHWLRSSLPLPAVIAPVVMAVLILLIAIFNFTNTSIAMSSRRLKEIGIRKVMGGGKQQLRVQFILENILLCLFAGIVALLLAEVLVPAYNAMWEFVDLDLNYLHNSRFLWFMFSLLIITGLVAGSYPAFYISSFEPTAILKGTQKFGGTNLFTKVLLTLQYVITLIALISAVAFIQNAKFQQEIDLGFDANGILYTFINGEDEYEAYKNRLLSNSDIIDITGTRHHILSYSYNDPVKHEGLEIETDILEVSEDYIKVMDINLVEGRNFMRNSETDANESIIINETLARSLGLKEPVGKKVVWMDTAQFYVIGVFKDYYQSALWDPVRPVMFRLAKPKAYTRILVKAKTNDLADVNDFMELKWKELFPNKMYNGRYMDQELKEASIVNKNILRLFIFLGIVATILSASGLFSMASLNIIKRMKEIGIRKVLGASIGNIATKLNSQFIMILIIASILGSIFSYYTIDSFMASIWAYYEGANILTFITGVFIVTLVSVLTIGYKIYGAALMNPVDSLKNE